MHRDSFQNDYVDFTNNNNNNRNFKTDLSFPAAPFSQPDAERSRKRLLILCCTSMHTKHAWELFSLTGDKMAAMASTKPIRPASTSLKATVWQHFQFHEVEGRIDKTYTVCKVCGTQLKYFGNTTNFRNHLARYHPELGEKQRSVADASQRMIEQVVAQLQPNSERITQITKSIASFIAMD